MVPFPIAWRLWIAGLFMQGIPFALLFYGEQSIEPAVASILNSTVGLWAFILNVLIFREMKEFKGTKIVGMLISLTGVLTIFWHHLTLGKSGMNLELLAILGMAISYGLGSILTQRVFSGKIGCHFQANLWQQHLSSLAFLMILSISLEAWPDWNTIFDTKTWLAFVYLGLFSTALAWIIYFHLIRAWDAVKASSVTYIMPILAICWDYLFLHLIPGWNELTGAFLILCGVSLIQRKSK